MYTLTPDLDFIVGCRRDLPGVVLLGGFSGHGFKFSPLMGEVAAQLALTGETDMPIALFDPHRFEKTRNAFDLGGCGGSGLPPHGIGEPRRPRETRRAAGAERF